MSTSGSADRETPDSLEGNLHPLRVLFVLTSADRRGAETQGRNVADALAQRGLQTEAVALSAARYGDGLDVEVIGDKPLSLAALRSLRRRACHCDVVVAFGSTSLPACAVALTGLRRPRLVYRSIGDPRAWVRSRIHRLRTRLFFLRVDHVAALWTDAAVAFGELYGVSAERRSVVPNSRSPQVFRPCTPEERSAARSALGYMNEDLVVAFVGALNHEKRPSLAAAALEHIPAAKLVVAGDGPLRSELVEQAASALPDRVQVLGSVNDVTVIYRAADVVLLTSSTEGMPGVLLEAAMSGLPAASSSVGSVPDLAAAGCVIEVFSPEASAEEIARAVARAAARSSESSAAVPGVADRFSTSSVVQQWIDLISGRGR